ncbi:MAG: FHA domain-containing protein [Gemmatimonadota bacterium]|nr:FHA domain-containing protein [Gemmatimonadota bacterium]
MSPTKSEPKSRGPAIQVQVVGRAAPVEFNRAFVIGRGDDCDVVIKEDVVSLRHAEVAFSHGEWRIRDLGSTNGTYVHGKAIESVPVQQSLNVRLGYSGPLLLFTPLGAQGPARETVSQPPRASAMADRYFGDKPPDDMSEYTAKMRRIVKGQQRKHAKKYRIAVAVLAVVAVAVGGFAYWQRQMIKQQRAAAAELFYTTKALELEVSRLQFGAVERQSYRERRVELERRYQEMVEALGIYDDNTREDLRLVYRVAHRFGESEVNVPREFIDEVFRHIARWKRSGELETSIARAAENNYGPRIAEVMLEHDLPPEFFYLALQESRLKVEAVGPETRFGFAKGMWQFLPSTGRAYGLQPGPLVGQPLPDGLDDRHDFEKATQAAARYLYDIYTTDAQASGLLVIASYNWGQTNIIRLIRSLPETPRERNFWNLLTKYRDRIPQETYGYVFNIVAAAVIGENPGLFGFDFPPPLPVRDSVVTEPAATSP